MRLGCHKRRRVRGHYPDSSKNHRARALPRLVEKFPIFPSFALVLGSAIGICKRGPIEGGHGALYQVKRYSMYDLALLPFEFGR